MIYIKPNIKENGISFPGQFFFAGKIFMIVKTNGKLSKVQSI